MGYFGGEQDLAFEGKVFPDKGATKEDVMKRLSDFDAMDVTDIYSHNTIQSTTLMSHLEAAEIAKDANRMFLRRNYLYKELLPGCTKMGLEVKQMVKEMLRFPEDARVRFTSRRLRKLVFSHCRRQGMGPTGKRDSQAQHRCPLLHPHGIFQMVQIRQH